MDPPLRGARVHGNPRRAADFVGAGFAAVISAVSFLLLATVGGGTAGVPGDDQWQVILAFALVAAGTLSIMHGMLLRDARAQQPAFAWGVADDAAAALWDAGGPERLLPVLILLMCSFLEGWFHFI